MTTRTAWQRNRAQHDQRSSPAPRLRIVEGSDTTWIPAFVESIQGIRTPLTLGSILCVALGETAEEREVKLRKLANMDILRMVAVNRPSYVGNAPALQRFSHFEWMLTEAGRIR